MLSGEERVAFKFGEAPLSRQRDEIDFSFVVELNTASDEDVLIIFGRLVVLREFSR